MDKDERRSWLDGLQDGDKVKVGYSTFSRVPCVATIERFTPKQIVMTDGSRCRRDDGRRIGESYGAIAPITQDDLDRIEHSRLCFEVGKKAERYEDMPLRVLRQINHMLQENESPAE